ncbi:MAG TPA: ribonuclease P protein component 1 [Thermoproteales archaeon]|uniref:Ribonuclease P protein component 1 n=1 Tax=Thermoproteota archaeon TaxID=2056631 RepID=A0A497EX93_9CREN|nr:MAG: ribonuclease P protein subunit [Candidatus Verstraetearchaeota archaeon]HDH06878.1 ribonuclease P protein component 1 [Thermoproteales archaeon]
MKITPRNIVMHELIGLHVKVSNSTHPGYIGIEGKVVYETMKTLHILHKGKVKIVPKSCSTFQFTLPDGSIVEVDGKVILARPEDRVKRIPKKRW